MFKTKAAAVALVLAGGFGVAQVHAGQVVCVGYVKFDSPYQGNGVVFSDTMDVPIPQWIEQQQDRWSFEPDRSFYAAAYGEALQTLKDKVSAAHGEVHRIDGMQARCLESKTRLQAKDIEEWKAKKVDEARWQQRPAVVLHARGLFPRDKADWTKWTYYAGCIGTHTFSEVKPISREQYAASAKLPDLFREAAAKAVQERGSKPANYYEHRYGAAPDCYLSLRPEGHPFLAAQRAEDQRFGYALVADIPLKLGQKVAAQIAKPKQEPRVPGSLTVESKPDPLPETERRHAEARKAYQEHEAKKAAKPPLATAGPMRPKAGPCGGPGQRTCEASKQ